MKKLLFPLALLGISLYALAQSFPPAPYGTSGGGGSGGGGTVTSVSGGSTGLTVANPTTTPTLGGTLAVASGGTGTASPGLVGGVGVSVTGSWPDQTITATGATTDMVFMASITFTSSTGATLPITSSTVPLICNWNIIPGTSGDDLQVIFNGDRSNLYAYANQSFNSAGATAQQASNSTSVAFLEGNNSGVNNTTQVGSFYLVQDVNSNEIFYFGTNVGLLAGGASLSRSQIGGSYNGIGLSSATWRETSANTMTKGHISCSTFVTH